MLKKSFQLMLGALLTAASLLALPAMAQDAADDVESPLRDGPYLAPMASYVFTDDKAFDDGYGGTLAAGYRKGWWAIEASGLYDRLGGAHGGRNTDAYGGTINGLLFPGSGNLFGILGAGALDIDRHPIINREFSITTVEGGAGYIFPLKAGRYEFGLRADARYRYGKREKRVDPGGDLDIPRHFEDVLINIGLQLPLGLPPLPPPPAPVNVVPLAALCADGMDNDGDGKIDFPADAGCTSAEDGDETDPPACSDGVDNDGDGLIDFPADKGCTSADDTDEADPCRTPSVGETMSLKGCGTGDVIILKGVTFEFDKSRLTPNAKTILDGVATELLAYPDIGVELGGHTDAKGSDSYNQRLSEQRAASVLKYLATKGVAKDRMTSVGYGESQPVADNDTDEGRELNRRVELKITAGSAVVVEPADTAVPAPPAPAAEPAAPAEAPPAP